MDNYKEQLVSKKPDGADALKKICVTAGALALCVISFVFLNYFAIVLIALIFYAAYILISGTYVEYEYIFTNSEIDIDKVIAKKKRKRLISFDLKNASGYGSPNDISDNKSAAVVNASSGTGGSDICILVKDSKYGMRKIIMSPDEELKSLIEKSLPRTVAAKIRF